MDPAGGDVVIDQGLDELLEVGDQVDLWVVEEKLGAGFSSVCVRFVVFRMYVGNGMANKQICQSGSFKPNARARRWQHGGLCIIRTHIICACGHVPCVFGCRLW